MAVQSKRPKVSVSGKEYGDGKEWCRGSMIGSGGSASVFVAFPKDLDLNNNDFPSQIAVKSGDASFARLLRKEAEVFNDIAGCPYIVTCFGNETTMGRHTITYNILLEYCSGGTLADRISDSCCGLPENEVRSYAWSILKGLCHIHRSGYIHCDLKPENIFLVPYEGGFTTKIGDFGLSMKEAECRVINRKIGMENKAKECVVINKKRKFQQQEPCPYWRGTFEYMSPEAVVFGMQFFCSDVWALGCIVFEMLTGSKAWQKKTDTKELSVEEVVDRIRTKGELPEIPNDISEEAKSFLKLCLVRSPVYRSGAESLLHHSFFRGMDM